MKKLKSKKGLTLVELVVTIAILGMVAGMGIGIVANAIQNYATAQRVSQEQDTALAVEEFILNAIRTSDNVELVGTSGVPASGVSGSYLFFEGNGNLRLVKNGIDLKNGKMTQTQTMLRYSGVKQIEMTARRQKPANTLSVDQRCYIYIDYTIEMAEGYTLKGSAVLNNAVSEGYSGLNVDSGSIVDESVTKMVIQRNEPLNESADPIGSAISIIKKN